MLGGIVHGVDLRHAAGQVTKKPRPDLGVNPFTGRQETGNFICAFAESCSVFPKHGGVSVQSSSHLNSLEVPKMFHSHLKDVRLLKF